MEDPSTIDPTVRARDLAAKEADALDPVNLYNITRLGPNNEIDYAVIPPEITAVDAPIAVIYSSQFPIGSHKVGASYSVLAELVVTGEVDP